MDPIDLVSGALPKDTPLAVTLVLLGIFSFTLAWVGASLNHRSSIKLSRRNENLDRLNRQLGDLYGPMRMLRYAGETGFRTFKNRYFPNRQELFWKGQSPTDEEYAAWRTWLKFTLMPINKQIERLLLEHGELIEGRDIPQSVLDFFAHVSALEATIAQWEQGNFKEYKAGLRYPTEFNQHVDETYKKLLNARDKILKR